MFSRQQMCLCSVTMVMQWLDCDYCPWQDPVTQNAVRMVVWGPAHSIVSRAHIFFSSTRTAQGWSRSQLHRNRGSSSLYKRFLFKKRHRVTLFMLNVQISLLILPVKLRLCVSECPKGFWGDRWRCKRCPSSCEVCTGSRSDQCTSCQPGYHLTEGTNVCTAFCEDNYYLDHGWFSVQRYSSNCSKLSSQYHIFRTVGDAFFRESLARPATFIQKRLISQ